jgi:hypothetical protein
LFVIVSIACALPANVQAAPPPYAQWFRPFGFWRGQGFDKESLIADPQFVDAKRHDYRLKPSSPALGLGFEPIDLSTVGSRYRVAR